MEHIAALLLLIGCSDDMVQCKELPAPTVMYETVDECEAVLPDALAGYTSSFPQILAQCVRVDPSLEEEDADLVWNIRPDGTLIAAVETPDVMVAKSASGPSVK